MTQREQWEDVSFQVFTDEDGVLRSGIYPTGEGLVSGNVAIAREWGNTPMQPNDDRDGIVLGSKDSHAINGTEWNSFPAFTGSRNYMVTGVEYLGGNVYEYISENKIEVGEYVKITETGFGNTSNALVTYADATKFRTDDELGTGKLTGLYGRVDVNEPGDVGNTLNGGDSYIVPSYTFCWSNPKTKDGNVWDYIEYLRTVGVDPELLVEATFDGANKYDWGRIGNTNDRLGGIIFWDYIPADLITYIDWETGTVYTGKDFDQTVTAMFSNAGDEVSITADWFEHSVVAFTNDPNKNNTADWWY